MRYAKEPSHDKEYDLFIRYYTIKFPEDKNEELRDK